MGFDPLNEQLATQIRQQGNLILAEIAAQAAVARFRVHRHARSLGMQVALSGMIAAVDCESPYELTKYWE